MRKILLFLAIVISAATVVFLLPQRIPENEEPMRAEKQIAVEPICQYPTLPTGCEATAATMVLRFLGIDITAEQFAGEWLECDNEFYRIGDRLHGPDPRRVFAGDPFSDSSFGCYAPVITRAVNQNTSGLTAKQQNDTTLASLCKQFIDRDIPVIIWATTGMKQPTLGNSWQLADGGTFTWKTGEHCLVLIGYNEDYFFFCDPQSGSIVAYQKAISELRFAEMGSQAIIITKTPLI